ncbi:hypothetical protein [Clostridium fermenticellae]
MVYPYWAMWYLLSLFIWDIMSPYFLRIKHPILIALFISLLCGYDNNVGYYLSLSRTIVFFPYFLMGYFCKKSYISTIKKYVRKKYAIVGVLSVLLILYMMNSVIDYRWFYGSYSYSQLSSLSYPKYFMRMATYIMAVTISIFILTLIPGKKLFFTKLGSRTMAVYVFHGFIVKELVKYNFFDHVGSLPSKVFIIIFSLLIVIVLSSKFMNKITKMISNPPFFNQINPTKI